MDRFAALLLIPFLHVLEAELLLLAGRGRGGLQGGQVDCVDWGWGVEVVVGDVAAHADGHNYSRAEGRSYNAQQV